MAFAVLGIVALGAMIAAAVAKASGPGVSSAPTREDLEAAAAQAVEDGDDELAADLQERAEDAPSASETPAPQPQIPNLPPPTQTAPAPNVPALAGDPLQAELTSLSPADRAAVESALQEDDATQVVAIRQLAEAMEARGLTNVADALEAQIEELAASVQQEQPANIPPPQETGPVDVPPAQGPAPTMPQDSAGYNPSLARTMAPVLARMIAQKQFNYSRDSVRAFQRAAGIAIDGVYGPQTRGALIYYGVRNPPRALFGSGTTEYVPPV